MELVEVLKAVGISGGIILFLASFIKIPKIELNVWGWVFSKMGKAFNHDLSMQLTDFDQKLSTVESTLNKHIETSNKNKADDARKQILDFDSDIYYGKTFRKEKWDEMLSTIDIYEDYCTEHPSYENNKAVLAIKNIESTYEQLTSNHGFDN